MATRIGRRLAPGVPDEHMSWVMWIWIGLAVVVVMVSIVAGTYPS